MRPKRSSDSRILAILSLFGFIGVATALLLVNISFPVASIRMALDRDAALAQARQELSQRGHQLAAYSTAATFEVDDPAKAYVHAHEGLARLNELGDSQLNLWRWRVRFFVPGQLEEFNVRLAPSGRLVGLEHTLPNTAAAPSISHLEARELADRYLAKLVHDTSAFRLFSSASEDKPARTEHRFVFESVEPAAGEARERCELLLRGTELAGYCRYLKLPEQWLRDSAIQANRGYVLANLGWTATYYLAAAALVVALIAARSRRVRFAPALAAAALVLAVILATALNSTPLLLVSYPTAESLAGYLLAAVIGQFNNAAPSSFAVLLALLAAPRLWQALDRYRPPWQPLRGMSAGYQVMAGYCVAGAWLGFVTLFYALGSSLAGFWTPAEVPYRDVMSTLAPLLYPLTVGFVASLSEELLFRYFGLAAFLLAGLAVVRAGHRSPRGRSVVGILFAALLLPAVIWASLHATYPQQPFYARTLELTIVGIASGLLFLRVGLLACLVAHYAYNASVIGGLYFLSGNPSLYVQAVIVLVVPALAYWGYRTLPGDRVSRLISIPKLGSHIFTWLTAVAERLVYCPRSSNEPYGSPVSKITILALAVLAAALALFYPGAACEIRLERAGAEAAAARVAEASITDLTGYRKVTILKPIWQGGALTYALRAGDTVEASVGTEALPVYGWVTRFFKPTELVELTVTNETRGELQGLRLRLAETSPGARLSADEAHQLASGFVHEATGMRLAAFRMVDQEQIDRAERTDHRFVWESNVVVGEAPQRLRVVVAGDVVAEYSSELRLPQSFERTLQAERSGSSAAGMVSSAVRGLLAVMVTALWLYLFVRRQLRSQKAMALSLIALVLGLLSAAVSTETQAFGYWTSIEWLPFVVDRINLLMRGLAFDTVTWYILASVALSLLHQFRGVQAVVDAVRQPQQLFASTMLLFSALLLSRLAVNAVPLVETASASATPNLLVPPFNSSLPFLTVLYLSMTTALTTAAALSLLTPLFSLRMGRGRETIVGIALATLLMVFWQLPQPATLITITLAAAGKLVLVFAVWFVWRLSREGLFVALFGATIFAFGVESLPPLLRAGDPALAIQSALAQCCLVILVVAMNCHFARNRGAGNVDG